MNTQSKQLVSDIISQLRNNKLFSSRWGYRPAGAMRDNCLQNFSRSHLVCSPQHLGGNRLKQTKKIFITKKTTVAPLVTQLLSVHQNRTSSHQPQSTCELSAYCCLPRKTKTGKGSCLGVRGCCGWTAIDTALHTQAAPATGMWECRTRSLSDSASYARLMRTFQLVRQKPGAQ